MTSAGRVATGPPAPGHRGRRLRRLLVGAVAGVLVLAALALLVVHTPPVRRLVLTRLSAFLADRQIGFGADDISYNLADLSVELHNVRVRSLRSPDAPAFLVLPHVRADLALLAVLRGRYEVQSALIERPQVYYQVGEDGESNLPTPPPGAEEDPDAPGQPVDYLLDEVRVEDADVRYEDQTAGVDLHVPVASIAIDGNALTDAHAVSIAAGPGTLLYEGRRASISRVAGDLTLATDEISIGELAVDAAGSRVVVRGDVSGFAAPVLDLTVTSHLAVAALADAAGLEDDLRGTIDAETRVTGDLPSLVVETTADGKGIAARGVAPGTLSIEATYDRRRGSVRAETLRVEAPWGRVSADGTIALDDASQTRVTLEAGAVDAAALMRAAGLPYTVASRVDLSASAQWPGRDYARATGEATATLDAAREAVAAGEIPIHGRIEATANDGDVIAELGHVTALGTTLDGEVRLAGQRGLAGRVTARVGDLGRTLPAVEALLGRPRGSLVPTPIDGRVTAVARLGGTVDEPRVDATLGAPGLAVGALSPVTLSAAARYVPDAVEIGRLDVRWRDAAVLAEGTIGLRAGQPLGLRFTADGVRVQSVLAALDRPDVPASGVVDLDGRVGGTVSEPRALVTMSAAGLSAYQEPLGTLAASVAMNGDRIELRRLALDKPQDGGVGHLEASGSYDLGTRAYTVSLRSDGVRLERLTLPDGRAVRADLSLGAEGTGTTREPRLTASIDADALRVGDVEVGPVRTDIDVENRRARIDATVERYRAEVNAVIGTDSPHPADAEVRVDGLQLDTLPVGDAPLAGDLTAHARATGELADLKAGAATVTLDALAASWNGAPVRIDGPAVLRYADRRLAIDTLRIEAQGSTVTLAGELPLDAAGQPGAVSVDAEVDLASAADYATGEAAFSADGRLALAGTLGGTLSALDPDLTLTVGDGLIQSPSLASAVTDLQVRATVRDGVAALDTLSAGWGSARLEASGRAPLALAGNLPIRTPKDAGPAALHATIDGLNPGFLPGAPEALGGLVSLRADFEAPDADLGTLGGSVRFGDLRVAYNTLDLAQQSPTSIAIAGGVATLERLDLSGSAGDLSAAGEVGLTGDRSLDVRANGQLDLAALSAVTDVVRAQGPTRIDLTANGTVANPELTGHVELTGGTLAVDDPRIGAEDVHLRLDLDGPRVTLSALTGNINGGTMEGSGYVTLGEDLIADADLQLSTRDFAFDAPLDLRTLSNSTFRITRQGEVFVVGGTVTVEEGGLTGDVDFNTAILGAVTAPARLDLTAERNPFLERVRFDVGVETEQPILVENNLAEAEVTTDLRVLGTPYETGLSGRLDLLEGGAVTLNEREYEVERGRILFTDERRIAPDFDLRLNTSASRYDITLAVNGPPGDTETTLTADPTLPEPDIMALLVTGRTLDEMRGSEFAVAREQVLSYLAGGLGARLGRGLEEATGLSEVRVEPNLIAGEEDPNARLTIAQELTDRLKLIFSNDLVDSNNQLWVAEYDATRRFQTRAVRQVDDTYRFDFQHDLRFGGAPEPLRVPRTRPTVRAITIDADGGPGEAALRDLLGVEVGDPFDYFEARDGVEDIQRYYRDHGWLQAHVRLRRTIEGDQADLRLAIESGPLVDLRFDGVTPPESLRDEVARQWQRGVFDTQRADDAAEAIRAWLMRDGHLHPRIEWTVDDVAAGRRRAVFTVAPGPEFGPVRLDFEGARGVDPAVLRDIVSEQDLEGEVFTDPTVVTELLERYYREEGYLDASIDEPAYDYGFSPGEARVVFAVDEGPRFHVADVAYAGNAAVPDDVLRDETTLVAGDPYLPAVAARSAELIRTAYWRRGYNDARIRYVLDANRDTGDVDVAFRIEEGPRAVVAEVRVEGTDRVSEAVVRDQLTLSAGDTLDLTAVGESRRKLYDTGAFSVADITRVPVGEAPASAEGDGQVRESGDVVKPVRMTVSLREVQPFQVRYGLSLDTERGLGGLFEVSNHNSLGHARVLGLSTRYDSQLHSARVFLSQPSLKGFPLQSTITAYGREERNPVTERTQAFNVDRFGISIQQEKQLGDHYVWNYGYRYEQARRWDPRPGAALDETVTVAPLTGALTRDTRDEPLDASTGSFLSHSFSFSPEWLGSDLRYVKYYGQFFRYFPLRPPTIERLTHNVIRPRLVFATGVRLGLAKGIGAALPASERFFAGGSNTLRGFAQNAVGQVGNDGVPLGGQALLVLNNELRFPIAGIVDGVTFLDVGQVYQQVSDFSFADLRKSAGVGLRLRTPWFLIRGDYGFVLDPRDGERRSRFYFSLGQAF